MGLWSFLPNTVKVIPLCLKHKDLGMGCLSEWFPLKRLIFSQTISIWNYRLYDIILYKALFVFMNMYALLV